jgi:predicted metal-dependent TIM-barrel fold hydrolase
MTGYGRQPWRNNPQNIGGICMTAGNQPMYIDPHIHMVSRTTDDYLAMRAAGIVAVIEPAFWLGQPRTEAGSFKGYYSSLVGWERFRASQFGICHYCTIGLNSKEANNEALAEQAMELLPLYACKEGVVAIGEIGFDEMTVLEEKYFRQQLELARELDMLVLVHTPHRNKKEGTSRSMDICEEHGLSPGRVIIDHNNEETVRETLDRGYWAAFTIYPHTKMGNERMVEIVRQYGAERIIVDSSADWGVSDPLAVPKTAALMRERGLSNETVHMVCYSNALAAYSQSGQMAESDWLNAGPIDQRELYSGNSVLRGQTPRIDSDAANNIIE